MPELDRLRSPTADEARGAANLVDEYLGCRAGDGLALGYASACSPGVAWIAATAALRDVKTTRLCTDDLDGPAFLEGLGAGVHDLQREGRRVVVAMCDDVMLRHSHELRQLQAMFGVPITRIMNCRPELFEIALQSTPVELSGANAALLQFLRTHDEVRVTRQGAATDLSIRFDPERYTWGSSTGHHAETEIPVLPAGEINTYSDAISGEFVVDGAIHTNFAVRFDVRLADRPLHVVVERGVVRSLTCPDRALERFLHSILAEENMRRIGEIGFGTNNGIRRFVAADSHINERHCGLHLGLGEHNQPGVLHYAAAYHVDLISSGGSVQASGASETMPLDHIAPRAGAQHPEGLRSEDLDHFPDPNTNPLAEHTP
jgi:hypothetical protein